MRRQDEFRATAFTMKDLLVERFAMPTCGCHGSNKIFFPRKGSQLRGKTDSLMTGAIFTNQRLTIGCEAHPPAAFGTHKTLRVDGAQAFRRRWYLIRIDDFIRFELALQNRECFTGTGVLQVVRQAILKRLMFFRRFVYYLAHPEPSFGQHVMVVARIYGAVQITLSSLFVSHFRFDDPAS